MGARGPRPLMAPRPLMGSEPWQQMPRGHPGRPPRPLMRPGHPVSALIRSERYWITTARVLANTHFNIPSYPLLNTYTLYTVKSSMEILIRTWISYKYTVFTQEKVFADLQSGIDLSHTTLLWLLLTPSLFPHPTHNFIVIAEFCFRLVGFCVIWIDQLISFFHFQGARFMASRSRGPSAGPGGARGAVFGHGPRPLLGRPQGPRVSMRHAG